MCGIAYSTQHSFPTLSIEHRGPDEFRTGHHELGWWAHSRLTTQGEPRTTNVESRHGLCLFNGDVYNFDGENDTEALRRNMQADPRDLMRSLTGEFSLVLAHEAATWFARDPWGTHQLHYYHDGALLAVASHADVLRERFGAAYEVLPDHVYRWDRAGHTLTRERLTPWDLTQSRDDWDLVHERLEQAVRRRCGEHTLLMLSGGHDSGVIMAAAEAQGIHQPAVTVPWGENSATYRERVQRHRPIMVKMPNSDLYRERLDRMREVSWCRYLTNEDTPATMAIIDQCAPRILINGQGGDEIYSDYGVQGRPLRWESRFGGHFPADLGMVWPWHTRIHDWCDRDDLVTGFHGVTTRYPLMDRELVQAWLNTTQRMKNSGYKAWMKDYMQAHGYPYSDIKTGFAQWRQDDTR